VDGQVPLLGARQAEWREERMAEVRRLTAALLRRGAQHVILFGSLAAREDAVGRDSDVDLVVVMRGVENTRFHRRLADLEEVQRFPYPLDIAVYSPGEWEEIRERAFVRNEVLAPGGVSALSGVSDARRWLSQAEADLAAARTNSGPHPHVA
jgi:predicted nucleotidyltransferase